MSIIYCTTHMTVLSLSFDLLSQILRLVTTAVVPVMSARWSPTSTTAILPLASHIPVSSALTAKSAQLVRVPEII